MGLGAIFVNQLVKWDDKLKEDLDKMLEKARDIEDLFLLESILRSTIVKIYRYLDLFDPGRNSLSLNWT
ncbi:uncharacterized protein A4U43_C07F38360 [Asparagus officinalis]|uniref:Uncharacterized protein n=1 Tax=Asparagus officinalis TaxID=4686 RepID=A0A5P1ELY7_ASPOF|nr:uncharacterized protein A4U43_C07F38360 [Asparagus officinalis]